LGFFSSLLMAAPMTNTLVTMTVRMGVLRGGHDARPRGAAGNHKQGAYCNQ